MAGFLAYPAVAPPSHHFLDSDDSVECVCYNLVVGNTAAWSVQESHLVPFYLDGTAWSPPSTKMRCKDNEKFLVLKY